MSIFNAIYETKKRTGLLSKKNRKENYNKYLQTKYWKKLRNQVRLRDIVCVRCGSSYKLQVNHKTYFRAGGEILDDLELLCEKCHKKYHNL